MSKNTENFETLGLKLNLDLEELRPKYDKLFPQIFQSLDHVKEPHVRSQFECLLSDVYDTFFKPEVEQSSAQKPTLFLEMVQDILIDPSPIKKRNLFHSIKLRRIRVAAVTKLDQAKALQKQIEDLDGYFESVISELPPLESKSNSFSGKTLRRPRSSNTLSKQADSHPISTSKDSDRNNTEQSTNRSDKTLLTDGTFTLTASLSNKKLQGTGVSSVSERKRCPLEEDCAILDIIGEPGAVAFQVKTKDDSESTDNPDSETNQNALMHRQSGVASQRGDGGDQGTSVPQAIRDRSRNTPRANKVRLMPLGATEFQLNLPPLRLRDSVSLVTKIKSGERRVLSPCRKTLENFNSSSTVKFLQESPTLGKSNWVFESPENSTKFSKSWASKSSSMSGSAYMVAPEALSTATSLVAKVQSMGLSLQERRIKIKTLKKSNAILSEQITEVSSTLESFDNYMITIKSKAHPVPSDTIKREMYAFQEAMMEKIFCCIELLNMQMRALRKTEQTKADKVKALRAKYEVAKKGNASGPPQVGGEQKSSTQSRESLLSNSELVQGLRAVLKGIESFHASCEDTWDETMNRVFTELGSLFSSLPSPPAKRWTPDDPTCHTSLSLSSIEALEEEVESLKVLPEDKSKYGSVVGLSLRMLERVSSELGHLMIVTRIKDLQIVSIDHSIGLAYMSMKQMLNQKTVKVPGVQAKGNKRNRPWRTGINEAKKKRCAAPAGTKKTVDKAETTKEAKLTPSQLVPHERNLRTRKETNVNADKRMLKRRLYEGRGAQADTRTANQAILAGQLETDNAQHMGSAADMRLPLLQLQDSGQGILLSSSQSGSFSPWVHHKKVNKKEDESQNQPKIAQTRVASKYSPRAKTKSSKMSLHLNKPRAAAAASASPRPQPIKNEFIQETVVLLNDEGKPVDCMGNVENHNIHRPIQYCRVLAMPTPPSANLIGNKGNLEEKKK